MQLCIVTIIIEERKCQEAKTFALHLALAILICMQNISRFGKNLHSEYIIFVFTENCFKIQ